METDSDEAENSGVGEGYFPTPGVVYGLLRVNVRSVSCGDVFKAVPCDLADLRVRV
jgi:hypothetical protein